MSIFDFCNWPFKAVALQFSVFKRTLNSANTSRTRWAGGRKSRDEAAYIHSPGGTRLPRLRTMDSEVVMCFYIYSDLLTCYLGTADASKLSHLHVCAHHMYHPHTRTTQYNMTYLHRPVVCARIFPEVMSSSLSRDPTRGVVHPETHHQLHMVCSCCR